MKVKKIIFGIFAIAVLASCGGNQQNVNRSPLFCADIERRIDSVMATLTLEQKVGQMLQLNLDVLMEGPNRYSSFEPLRFCEAALARVIDHYQIGSILNTANTRARCPEEWEYIVSTIQRRSLAASGIPILYGIDAIHGATYTAGATFFPHQIGMAASFNQRLVYEAARITAYEVRASNIAWNFSPSMDVTRHPAWPRMFESWGESIYMNARMSVVTVQGYQGCNPNRVCHQRVGATLKHFMGYGAPFSGRDRTPVVASPTQKREMHFEPFRASIQEGNALAVMLNSGVLNGVSSHADYVIITEWLKRDLNFCGVVLTDWADIQNLWTRDRIAHNYREAIKISINAGVDLVMQPHGTQFITYLVDLVRTGEVAQSRVEDAVRRILRLKFRLGLFERPYWSHTEFPNFGSAEHHAVARQMAGESITLLKNENNILPLREGRRILVAGPNANTMRPLNGGWTYSWQGNLVDEFAQAYNTIYQALQNRFGAHNVRLEEGVTWNMDGNWYEENPPQIARAVAAARNVDYIIVAIGENSYCEAPGNTNELTISQNQRDLVLALQATGRPVILVLSQGRPRIIRELVPGSAAILNTFLPGNFGGDALADILSGDVNPSGRLPFTYPMFEQGIITYDYKPSENIDGVMEGAYNYTAETMVQWSFGFGMSFTTFEYSNMRVDRNRFVSGDTLNVSVDITNTGDRFGKISALLFSSDLVASITPSIRRLRAFDKIALEPGQTKTVNFALAADDLAFVNQFGRWTLERGYFRLQIGDQYVMVYCTETRIWDTPNR